MLQADRQLRYFTFHDESLTQKCSTIVQVCRFHLLAHLCYRDPPLQVFSAHKISIGRLMQLLEELYVIRSQDGYRGSAFDFLLEVFMTG